MYDKTVRRRRALLALLVLLSLLLLTAYFGEAPSGRLHAVQRDFLTVVSPIQDGANKALKPVRDLVGWVDNTVHAKQQRDELLKQVDKLRAELVSGQSEKRAYHELLALNHLDGQLSISDYRPVSATVVGKSPNIWYATVVIDKGESAGIRVNDPVINGEGLVGKVALATSDGAEVSLITEQHDGRVGQDRHELTRPASCSQRSATPTTCCCSTCPPPRRPSRASTSSPRERWPAPTTRCTRRGS